MEAMLRLDDESADWLSSNAYALESAILNPCDSPIEERDPLWQARRMLALTRLQFGCSKDQEFIPDNPGLYAFARLFDALELAMQVAAEGRAVGTEAL